jgi:hypothetical protein
MPYFEIRKIAALEGPPGSSVRLLTALSVLLAALLFLACFPAGVSATVKGRCKDCHEMHSDSASPALTKGCLGCHAMDPAGTRDIIKIGNSPTPQVLHNMENGDLAGGNFYYVADDFDPDYGKGHNVVGISQLQPPPMDAPPGFIGSVMIPGGKGPTRWPDRQELTCAGTWGCHGDRTIEDPYKAIYGAHHEDDSVIDGSTVGKSYRFLFGIKGAEHRDWEYQATPADHNGYKGDSAHMTMDTISYLCGECHARFHPSIFLGGMAVGRHNPWHRHPTDVDFGSVHPGFTGSEYESYMIYSLETPVAFEDPTGKEVDVDGESIIMCMSCHRAHASPYLDSLRWDYTDMVAGDHRTGNNGCFTCHTLK